MLYKNIFQGKGKPSMQVATEQDQEVMGKRCQENRVWYCIASFGFCGVFLRLSAFTVGAVNLISMDRFNSILVDPNDYECVKRTGVFNMVILSGELYIFDKKIINFITNLPPKIIPKLGYPTKIYPPNSNTLPYPSSF